METTVRNIGYVLGYMLELYRENGKENRYDYLVFRV